MSIVLFEGTNVYEDEMVWENTCYEVERLMKGHERFKVSVSGFGWRGSSGTASIDASNGEELLQGMLPNTDCNFKVLSGEDGELFRIDNAHHDKPCGGEIYIVRASHA